MGCISAKIELENNPKDIKVDNLIKPTLVEFDEENFLIPQRNITVENRHIPKIEIDKLNYSTLKVSKVQYNNITISISVLCSIPECELLSSSTEELVTIDGIQLYVRKAKLKEYE